MRVCSGLTNWTGPPRLTWHDQSRSYGGVSGDKRRHFQTPTFFFFFLRFTFYILPPAQQLQTEARVISSVLAGTWLDCVRELVPNFRLSGCISPWLYFILSFLPVSNQSRLSNHVCLLFRQLGNIPLVFSPYDFFVNFWLKNLLQIIHSCRNRRKIHTFRSQPYWNDTEITLPVMCLHTYRRVFSCRKSHYLVFFFSLHALNYVLINSLLIAPMGILFSPTHMWVRMSKAITFEQRTRRHFIQSNVTITLWVRTTLQEEKQTNHSKDSVSDQLIANGWGEPNVAGSHARGEPPEDRGCASGRQAGRQPKGKKKKTRERAEWKTKMLTLMLGFFRMNPRYQPAETKQCFNIHHGNLLGYLTIADQAGFVASSQ